jgi:hypothetical protein
MFLIKNYQYIFKNYFERNIHFYAEFIFESTTMASLKIWGLASDKIEKRKIFFVCVDKIMIFHFYTLKKE